MASASTSTAPPAEEQDALKASIFQRLHPRVYLERFVAEGVRPDGRAFSAWRDVSVNVGSITTADGSALVRMGDTTIVVGVKAEIAEPELDREGEGYLVPNLDLPAICSPKFKPGPPAEEAQVLSDRLNEVLVASNLLPLSSLLIHPGKSAWVIYLDATCINYDGNAFDAALAGMVAALRNTKLPKATYNEETGRTTCSRRPEDRVPLKLQSSPISFSFGVFDSKHILSDPSAFEEPLLDTTISIVLSDSGDLVSVSQLGPGMAQDQDQGKDQEDALMSCIKAAKHRHAQVKGIYESNR